LSIDPEIQAFIDASDAFYPPDAAHQGIEDRRRVYDAYAAAFGLPRPADVTVEDGGLALPDRTIGLRLYRPPGRARGTILYAHGGGFMLGSLDSHDGIVARIAARTGAEVVSVDYRLAPEHPCPAALDDVLAVLDAFEDCALPWDLDAQRPLVLAGDSAGAMLVASAALRRAGTLSTPLAGLALVYPALGFEPALPARDTEAEAPMLTLAQVRFYRENYLAGRQPDAWTFPLDAESIEGLPPVFLLAAEHDPLRDDCAAFADRLHAVGTPASLVVGRGLVHGFLRAIDRSRAAGEAFDLLIRFLDARLEARND
jgi:acetyl esterase